MTLLKVILLTFFITLQSSTLLAAVNAALFTSVNTTLEKRSPKSCEKNIYSELSKNGVINIALIYGYNDQRPYINVLDSIEKNVLQSALLNPCSSSTNRLCGYSVKTPNQLSKSVTNSNGSRTVINISLISSSISQDDNWNRGTGAPQQNKASSTAREDFKTALLSSDIVFYIGHARAGGGPDFNPPRLKENQQVDLNSYKTEKAGITLLLKNLKDSRNLQLLGLFSCNSAKLFSERLTGTRKDISYLLAGDIATPSAMNSSMWASLDAITGPTCSAEMKDKLTKINATLSKDHFYFIPGTP